MVHGVHISEGRATYRNRYVANPTLAREFKEGKSLYRCILGATNGLDGLFSVVRNGIVLGDQEKMSGNTSMLYHHGKLFACCEGTPLTEMQSDSLETVGPYDFNSQWKGPFTAHPKIDIKTGQLMTMSYVGGVQYGVFSKEGKLQHSSPIQVPYKSVMHDFAATENYTIFFVLPCIVDPEGMVSNKKFIRFDRSLPSYFGVVDRLGSQPRWFTADPCYIFHTLNAYEEGDHLVLQALRYSTMDIDLLCDEDDRDKGAVLHEWRFNLKTGSTSERQLDDTWAEFPQASPFGGLTAKRFGYAAMTIPRQTKIFGILKYDLQNGSVSKVELGNYRYGGEPVFVPYPGATDEQQGWLMTYVHDESLNQSELLILEARDLSTVARIEIPQRVPYGFHGTWVPTGSSS